MNKSVQPLVKDLVYSNKHYNVHVVRMPDMTFDTYGIINSKWQVIEQVQPNLHNAKYIADQFAKWLETGPDSDSVAALMESIEGFNGLKN